MKNNQNLTTVHCNYRVCWWTDPARSKGFTRHGIDYVFLGLYSLSGKTSYRKISWSLEAARFGFKLFQSLWNLAGTSAVLLPMCLSNFKAIRPLQHPISRLRDFTRFGGKTSYRLVNRGPAGISRVTSRITLNNPSRQNACSVLVAFLEYGATHSLSTSETTIVCHDISATLRSYSVLYILLPTIIIIIQECSQALEICKCLWRLSCGGVPNMRLVLSITFHFH